VATFPPEVFDAAAREREVKLTTFGRKSGKEHRVTIWIATDGQRLYVRSGEGLRRHWPQNLLAKGWGLLRLGKSEVKVKPRHLIDPVEARTASELYKRKYGPFVRASKERQPLTLGEQATFELLPADGGS